MEFAGRTAVVTGAASGIGRATAISFARRGARLVVADIDGDGAATTAAQINAEIAVQGVTAVGVGVDVVAEDAFTGLRDTALEHFGRVDLIMNNVGVLTRGYPDHIPLDEWRRVLEINLFSVIRSNAVFVPMFLERGQGHIVNTASFAGLFTYSYDRQPYAASKAAIVQISEGLRLYLEPQGIGVTLVCPGPVRTNISRGIRSFGPETVTRSPGPQFAVLDPAAVGEMVANAVIADQFLVATDQQVVAELCARAADWNGYLAAKVAEFASD